jgi:hypothetical protein
MISSVAKGNKEPRERIEETRRLLGGDGAGVDVQLGVADNLLDLTLLLEVGKGLAGKGAVDLQAIDEGSNGDQAVGLNILVELLKGGLLEDNGVLSLVLD